MPTWNCRPAPFPSRLSLPSPSPSSSPVLPLLRASALPVVVVVVVVVGWMACALARGVAGAERPATNVSGICDSSTADALRICASASLSPFSSSLLSVAAPAPLPAAAAAAAAVVELLGCAGVGDDSCAVLDCGGLGSASAGEVRVSPCVAAAVIAPTAVEVVTVVPGSGVDGCCGFVGPGDSGSVFGGDMCLTTCSGVLCVK